MPTDALLGQMFNLGFPAVIAVLIFFAYRDQTKALLEVVRNNTQAISEFKATQSKTVDDLSSHDERAEVIGDCVDQATMTMNRVDVRTQRIEEKLDRHDKTVQGLLVRKRES